MATLRANAVTSAGTWVRIADDVPMENERRDAVVIVNPASHNAPKRKQLQEADEWLRESGWTVEWQETQRPGDATMMATATAVRRIPLLFVYGGDGTLSEAAKGLAGSETALSVIPAGTVNLWAREIGLLKSPLQAVRLAVLGERRCIDLGRAGSRYFMLMAGYGLDGAVAHRVSHGVKGRLGAAAYALTAARQAITYKSSRVTIRLDKEEQTADVLMLVAGNTRKYAGITEITSEARVDDGLLDVCVYTGGGKLDLVLHAARTVLRRHLRSKKVLYRRVRRLELAWRQPLLVQMDGDACPESPQEVTIAPAALWVAVPKGLRSPLFSH